MEYLISLLRKPVVRRLFVFAVFAYLVYLLRSMMTLFLLTFIFVFIFNSLQNLLYRFVTRFFPIKRGIVIAFIYLVFVTLLVLLLRVYVPVIIKQTTELIADITAFLTNVKSVKNPSNIYTRLLILAVNNFDISKYVGSGGQTLISFLQSFGTTSMYVFISLILSLFFMIDKKKVLGVFRAFKTSKLYWMYDDMRFFSLRFFNTFGKVIQNQILISFINSILSLIILACLGFPSLIGLVTMVFILGLVPVAGVFISLVPLTIIAYSIGGLRYVIYILILITVLHALEGYVLNPKLMSHQTKLPIFFTLLILFVGEHLLGVWGLIVSLPLTVFILDVLDVLPKSTVKTE